MCGKGVHVVERNDKGVYCYIDYFCDIAPCGGWFDPPLEESRCPHLGQPPCTCEYEEDDSEGSS